MTETDKLLKLMRYVVIGAMAIGAAYVILGQFL